jgi:hypothetical protein
MREQWSCLGRRSLRTTIGRGARAEDSRRDADGRTIRDHAGSPPACGAHQGLRRMTLDCVQSMGADAVLNLAAGLDARPYRLPLPSSLVWIEADRAAIFDEKAEVLAPSKPACVIERLAVDLADDQARESLFDRVAGAHARVVVVTEGLLVYLDEARVATDREAPLPGGSTSRRSGREVPHARLLRALSSLSGRFRRRMENLVVYGVLQPSAE